MLCIWMNGKKISSIQPNRVHPKWNPCSGCACHSHLLNKRHFSAYLVYTSITVVYVLLPFENATIPSPHIGQYWKHVILLTKQWNEEGKEVNEKEHINAFDQKFHYPSTGNSSCVFQLAGKWINKDSKKKSIEKDVSVTCYIGLVNGTNQAENIGFEIDCDS